jgi:hypothetical protein
MSKNTLIGKRERRDKDFNAPRGWFVEAKLYTGQVMKSRMLVNEPVALTVQVDMLMRSAVDSATRINARTGEAVELTRDLLPQVFGK